MVTNHSGGWLPVKLPIPVARMHCAHCRGIVDLEVGSHKDTCVDYEVCPICKGHEMCWLNSYKDASTEGCIYIEDEVEL